MWAINRWAKNAAVSLGIAKPNPSAIVLFGSDVPNGLLDASPVER